jgi:hypothetical protein
LQDIPRRVLIIKKPIPEAAQMLLEMAEWLQNKGVQVCWGGRRGVA